MTAPWDFSSFLGCGYLVLSASQVGPKMTPQIANLQVVHTTLILENQLSHSTNSSTQTCLKPCPPLHRWLLSHPQETGVKSTSQPCWGQPWGKQLILLHCFWRAEAPQYWIGSENVLFSSFPSIPWPSGYGTLIPRGPLEVCKRPQLHVAAGYYLTPHLREVQFYLSAQFYGQENMNGARRFSSSEFGDPPHFLWP